MVKHYTDLINKKTHMEGEMLMSLIPDDTASSVFLDPQYDGVLEKLSYGNEGERQKGRATLRKMPKELIQNFCNEIDRVLKPSGHLFLWVDKFHLVQATALEWSKNTELEVVGLITWDKKSFGMGYRTRATSEHLLIFQKKPLRAKDVWTDRSIRDIWRFEHEEEMSSVIPEKIDKPRSGHPHKKPIGLIQRLINATTVEGDLILDPAAGSFLVKDACENTGRNFIGCDIEKEYCK